MYNNSIQTCVIVNHLTLMLLPYNNAVLLIFRRNSVGQQNVWFGLEFNGPVNTI